MTSWTWHHWHWPWSRGPLPPPKHAAQALAAIDDADRALVEEKARGPEVTRVSDALVEHARVNHIAELLEIAMTPRKD